MAAFAAMCRAKEKAHVRAGFFFAALTVSCAACLSGCISLPQTDAIEAAPPAGIPRRVELTQVPLPPAG